MAVSVFKHVHLARPIVLSSYLVCPLKEFQLFLLLIGSLNY